MENPKSQLIEKLKTSNNVLVTVSRNPSVDQLSSAIGTTLLLNALGKHATAVFSGSVPSTIEFLQPEETLEKTTDSLRDFIISLDKSKADKLRYKVEDKMVKIFITPYRTSITQEDLVYSQGDFNVDLVIALGVHQKEDLDDAIISHGRILHDATVATLNTVMSGQLGTINWIDDKASSLSEMMVPVCDALKADGIDAQMATAFLTGIVAETDRFSNEKTTSDTMKISARLMSAGANQQLVATKLQEPAPEPVPPNDVNPEVVEAEAAVAEILQQDSASDGSLQIGHDESVQPDGNDDDIVPAAIQPEEPPVQAGQDDQESVLTPDEALLASTLPKQDDDEPLPEIKHERKMAQLPEEEKSEDESSTDDEEEKDGREGSRFILEPPTLGGTLTANSAPEDPTKTVDPLSLPPLDGREILNHDEDKPAEESKSEDQPQADAEPVIPTPEETIEEMANQPPAEQPAEPAPEAQVAPEVPEITIPDTQTLSDLEQKIDESAENAQEPAVTEPGAPDAQAALEEAMKHASEAVASPDFEVPAALNAGGFMDVNHEESNPAVVAEAPASSPDNNTAQIDPGLATPPPPGNIQIDPSSGEISFPENLVPPDTGLPTDSTASSVTDATSPPPVPPPMMPPAMPPEEDGSTDTQFPLPK